MSDTYSNFLTQLHEYSVSGQEPALAAKELRYVLDLQEKRLKQFGIQKEELFNVPEGSVSGGIGRDGTPYYSRILYSEPTRTRVWRRGTKEIRRKKEPLTMYLSLTDKKGWQDKEISCPNCGHPGTAGTFRDGCPYCHTMFESDDIYPVVSYCYSVPAVTERATLQSRVNIFCKYTGIISGIILAVLMFWTQSDYEMLIRILVALFFGALYGAVFAFIAYMGYSMTLLFRLFREAGRTLPMLGGLGSDKKMKKFMEMYDPSFSFEVFQGKVISLIREAAFQSDRSGMASYTGSEDLSFLDQIVNIDYRGALGVKRITETRDRVRAELKVWLTNTYYDGRLHTRDEKFIVTVERDKNAATDPGFFMHKVSCRSCGSSFDALHEACCPSCGTRYEPVHKDWVLCSLRRK